MPERIIGITGRFGSIKKSGIIVIIDIVGAIVTLYALTTGITRTLGNASGKSGVKVAKGRSLFLIPTASACSAGTRS